MLIRNAVKYSVGELGSRIPLMLLELILARSLGPTVYGIWSVIQTLVTYGNFLHFGVASSLARIEPVLIERGSRSDVFTLRATVYGFQILIIGIFIGLLLVASVVAEKAFAPIGGLVMAFSILSVVLVQQITITAQSSALNEYKVIEVSIAKLIYAVLFLVMGIFVVRYEQPLLWLTLGWAAALLIALIFLRSMVPGILLLPRFEWTRTVALLRDGFPIMLQGLFRFGLVSIDKLVVFAVARPEVVGYYGMGSLAASVSGIFGTMIARVSLPTLLRLRERNSGIDLLHAEFDRMVSLIQLLNYGVLFMICSFSPLLVHFFLPAYQPAMHVIGILTLAGGFAGVAQAMIDVAMSMGVKAAVLVNTSMTLVIQSLLLTLTWSLGAGVEGLAASVLTATVFLCMRGFWLAMATIGLQRTVARRRLWRSAVEATGVVLTSLSALEVQIACVDSMSDSPLAALTWNICLIIMIAIGMFVVVKRIGLYPR